MVSSITVVYYDKVNAMIKIQDSCHQLIIMVSLPLLITESLYEPLLRRFAYFWTIY